MKILFVFCAVLACVNTGATETTKTILTTTRTTKTTTRTAQTTTRTTTTRTNPTTTRTTTPATTRTTTISPISPIDGLPVAVDWRNYGWVTPVKNEGQCSCGWFFSATGALEGQVAKKYGRLVSLSEQNIADCSLNPYACTFGYPVDAFRLIAENGGGIYKTSYYPNTLGTQCRSGTCRYSATQTEKIGVKVIAYTSVPSFDMVALKQAVANVGPVAVTVDAFYWRDYVSGIFRPPICSPFSFTHAALIVGYDADASGQEYWIVKNSW